MQWIGLISCMPMHTRLLPRVMVGPYAAGVCLLAATCQSNACQLHNMCACIWRCTMPDAYCLHECTSAMYTTHCLLACRRGRCHFASIYPFIHACMHIIISSPRLLVCWPAGAAGGRRSLRDRKVAQRMAVVDESERKQVGQATHPITPALSSAGIRPCHAAEAPASNSDCALGML